MIPFEQSRYIGDINKELDKAEAKYPVFCNTLPHKDNTKSANAGWLNLMRHRSEKEVESGYSFEATIEEELAEVFEAWFDGDMDHCYQELAQCGAVIIRAMQFVKQQQRKQNDSNSNTCNSRN